MQSLPRFQRFAIAAIFVAIWAPVAHMQYGAGSGSGGSRAVSPTAVAAIWSHVDADHTPILEMLVLIRGEAGWYGADGPGQNGYSFSSRPDHSTNHAFASTAGVTVNIDSDSTLPNKKLTVTANLTTCSISFSATRRYRHLRAAPTRVRASC